MTIKELHQKLIEAYAVSNLNNISLTLINLYQNRQYSVLQKISELISDLVAINIMDDGKGFSKFMLLYHPDRSGLHINEINKLKELNNFDGLLKYSHILKLGCIEEIASSLNSFEDLDYSPVYEWDLDAEGFSITYDNEPLKDIQSESQTEYFGYTFYDAMKLREYGQTDIEYPSVYLEDIEEFELSSSDINDLDGIQFCVHAKTIDVSNNRISDLFHLMGLTDLEELNLSDNEIGFIDALSNLKNLRSVILSDNYIEDISPLFELEKLEYVELSGNNIDSKQLNKLTELGITVNIEY